MDTKSQQKQALFFTIINYIGIVIGVVSTLFIYPKNKEILGTFRYVEALAQVIFPILLLGASQALVNFHPKLNVHNRKQIFNYSVVSILTISSLFFILVLIGSYFPVLKGMKYMYYAFPIAIFLAFIELFKKQAAIIEKIALPSFFDAIIPKITLPIIFIFVINQLITNELSLFLYVLAYGFIFLFIGAYLYIYFKPNLNFKFAGLFTEVNKKDYFSFSLFAFAGSLGSVFAFRIDALMIPKFISMEANGTFSIGVTLASALAVPATGIFIVYGPIVSNYLKNNAIDELSKKYKEIAKLLFFIGALLYSCIFLGIENLFQLLPSHENLDASIPIILILGCNVLVNMGTGFNSEIITYSKYYKFNLVAIFILTVINVSLNLLFLVYFKWGLLSVAYASLLSMVFFNFAKLVFIYKKFKILPFDFSYFKLFFVLASVLVLLFFVPDFFPIFPNLVFKTIACLVINLIVVYKLKLVYSYNSFVDKKLFYKKTSFNSDIQKH